MQPPRRDFPHRSLAGHFPGQPRAASPAGRAQRRRPRGARGNGDQIVGINSSQIWVSIDPKADYDRTVAAIRETIDGYPASRRASRTTCATKSAKCSPAPPTRWWCASMGRSPTSCARRRRKCGSALAGIRGIVDLRTEGQVEEPQVKVKVNLDAAGRANIKPGDVRRASATVFSGITVGYLFEEQKHLRRGGMGRARSARQPDQAERPVGRARRSQGRAPGRSRRRAIVPTPTIIRHEGISPYVDVVANVRPGPRFGG